MLPVDRQNPPAFTVVEQLETVHASHERLGVTWIAPRIVSAPDVRDPAKLLGPPRNFRFVEAFVRKQRLYPCDVTFNVQNQRRQIDIVSSWNGRGRN
jgi:hypothetical protein